MRKITNDVRESRQRADVEAASAASAFVDKLPVKPYFNSTSTLLSGRNSAVECQLPKLDVAGSTPVARSKLSNAYTFSV